ncbi:MFS transporter [Blastococcus mobilis]|uniref:Predicted arabinose efflux permease, MFS family n=1 Tax=Blastococcus mobilis TaxID=1938746 RepID=A0A238Y487_9ACTN|nr:MFS transporter [Blastococcus mobilis]SNR65374.1 Predicted arabinose efflux permease, MFS family [Blastococcus mobilis]
MLGFALVTVATFLMVSGVALLAPGLPLLGESRGLTVAESSWILSAFALGRLLFSIPGGLLVDRLGFARAASVGCLLTLGGAVTAGLGPPLWGLLAAQAVQGAGSAVHNTAVLSSIIAALPDGRMARFLSLHQGVVLLGVSLSPVMGGVAVTAWGVSGPFWFYAGTTALSLVLSIVAIVVMPGLARPHARAAPVAGGRPLGRLMTNRSFVISLCVTFVLFWMVAGLRNTAVPVLAQGELGYTALLVGFLLGAAAVANGVCLFVAGPAADRFGRRPVLLAGTAVLCAGLVSLIVGTVPATWIGVTALGIGMGLAGAALPAILADVADPSIRGVAVGIHRTSSGLGLFVGPVTVGLLLQSMTTATTFAVGAGALALSVVAVLFVRETLVRPAPGTTSAAPTVPLNPLPRHQRQEVT